MRFKLRSFLFAIFLASLLVTGSAFAQGGLTVDDYRKFKNTQGLESYLWGISEGFFSMQNFSSAKVICMSKQQALSVKELPSMIDEQLSKAQGPAGQQQLSDVLYLALIERFPCKK